MKDNEIVELCFMAAAHERGVPALVVRGISDKLSGKSKSDKKGSQEIASRCASAFTIEILTHWSPEGFFAEDDKARTKKPINISELPRNYIPRANYLKAIKAELLSPVYKPTAITGKHIKDDSRLGIQGMAGIGKTIFAAAIAQDQEIIDCFKDGIFWITLGTDPNLVIRQSDLAKMLGDSSAAFEDVQQGKNHLSRLMANKRCLLVLDDIWHAADVEAFSALGQECRMLITTRYGGIIDAIGASEHRLDVLSDPEARKLLAGCTGVNVDCLICEAEQVKDEKCYRDLAVFPPDEAVPEVAVATLWMYSHRMKERHVHRLIIDLERKALLRRSGGDASPKIELHYIQHDYWSEPL